MYHFDLKSDGQSRGPTAEDVTDKCDDSLKNNEHCTISGLNRQMNVYMTKQTILDQHRYSFNSLIVGSNPTGTNLRNFVH